MTPPTFLKKSGQKIFVCHRLNRLKNRSDNNGKVFVRQMSREEKLVKNTAILSLGNFLPKLASTIILPILTGCMTKAEYGTYDLITVLVSLLLPAVTLQIQTAAFRFLIEHRGDTQKEKAIVTNIYLFTLPICLVVLVGLFFGLYKISLAERILICIYFLTDIFEKTSSQIARGMAKNKDYSVSAILGSLGRLLFSVIFVWYFRFGLEGATLCLIAATGVHAFYLLFRTNLISMIKPSLFDKQLLKEMIQYSWPMVPNSLSIWVMRVSDRLVVTHFMGLTANAVYSVANKIPSLLTVAQNTFTMAWQENASIVSKDEDAPKYYSDMFKAIYDFMAGAFGMLIAMTPLLFRFLIRGNYDEAYYQMPLLFLGMFFCSLTGYLGGIYVAYKKTKSIGITTIFAAVCNLVIDLTTIHFIGLYAASGSTLVSYFILFVYRMIDVRKFIAIKYNIPRLIIIGMILIIMSGLCYLRNPITDIINAVLGIILFIVLNGKLMMVLINKIFKKGNEKKNSDTNK